MRIGILRLTVWPLLALMTVTGCSWLDRHFVDRSTEYVRAESAGPLRVPPGLNDGAVEDVLLIPDLPPRPQAELFTDAAPRPAAMHGPEQEALRIQMLGDVRWLVIPQPPALVWPQLKEFFFDTGVPIASEVPSEGQLVTGWLEIEPGLARDPVRRAILEAKAEAGLSGGRDRLRIQLEQGLRSSSSEVVIKHEHDPGDGTFAPIADGSDLRAEAGATEVDRTLLNTVGGYIAASEDEPAFSLQAAALATRGKAEVTYDAGGQPVLRLDLDFDRAWAVVNQALTEAEVNVQDLDRSQGVFYLDVRERELTGEPEPGLFGRWRRQDPRHELRLMMQPGEDGYLVSLVHANERPVDRELSRAFLVRLREFAS
jgi:outer membrane protein assembly factor BamC